MAAEGHGVRAMIGAIRAAFQGPRSPRVGRPSVRSEAPVLDDDGHDTPIATVFVVEDDDDARQIYTRYLSAHGFRVAAASDGASAFNRIVESPPDVIVTDLSLPRLTGWELTRRLKGDPRTLAVPVIACTGHLLGWAMEHALDAGCDAYVIKPCLPAELMAVIHRVLADRSRQPA